MAPPRPPSAPSAPRSAPATSTPAPTIRPAMMASAACCRASPAKQRAGAGARPIRSPPMMLPRSWQRPASPGAPGAAWNRKRQQPTGAPPTRRLPGCCSRVACAGRKRRRCAGRTCRTRPTGAASWSTSAGRKPIRTAPRRTCATSSAAAPPRFASCATGSPYSGQGCARTAPRQVLGGINGQSIARRLTAAASAAGIEGRITGHSGRVGLAVELTRRGAPEQATAKAGGWKSSRMVAHYAAAVAAEQGAVATYL